MKRYVSILIVILSTIIVACSSKTKAVDPLTAPTPNIGVAIQTERELEVTAPKGWNSFKTNKPISLMIRNASEKPIVFDKDFGTRVFLFVNDQWVEIANKTIYADDQTIVNPDKDFDPMNIVGTFVLPDLPDYSIPSYVRVFVIGHVIENGKQTGKIASFIDIRLTP